MTVTLVYNPEGEFYTYAPSVIVVGQTDHIWTCHNAIEGKIKDSIYYIQRIRGQVVESRPVLETGTEEAWDSFHVCDPSVISGEFAYNGEAYEYALFYVGDNVDASAQNQIGVAFAHGLSAQQWMKYPKPIIPYEGDQWGVGQPSAVSLGDGRVMLIYTKGHDGTITYQQELDLSDMDTGPVYLSEACSLTNLGLTGYNGKRNYLNNVGIVYDPARDRLYAAREQHPYPTSYSYYISASIQIVSVPAEHIFNGGGRWKVEGRIDEALTGLARNHNAGISRTAEGTLPDLDALQIFFVSSCGDSPNCQVAEWMYDLWEVAGTLNDYSQ